MLALLSKELHVDNRFWSTSIDDFFGLCLIQMCLYGIMTKDIHHLGYLSTGKQLFAQWFKDSYGQIDGVYPSIPKGRLFLKWSWMIWSDFWNWLEEQYIVPYQDTGFEIEIIQKVRKEPWKRKQKYTHSQRLNLIDDLIENSLLTLLHHLIHNIDTAIHILKVLTEISNKQKVTIIRHPDKHLISLFLAKPTK